MTRSVLSALLVAVLAAAVQAAEESYDLVFSTYVGGSDWEHARDVCTDAQGNVYMVGGTASADYPTTPGAFQRVQDKTGRQVGSFGYCDAFVTKFGPDGRPIWSTLLGGPNYDRAYGVEVDSAGYVYVAGRAGPGFPVRNALQPTFRGHNGGAYGMQNAFVAKLTPDGSDLVWASYIGVSSLCRDIAIDAAGDIYVPLGYPDKGAEPPAAWFTSAFQKTHRGGTDCGAARVRGDGSGVVWATWIGGSGPDSGAASIRVGADGSVYLGFSTESRDIPTTPGAFSRSLKGVRDFHVARLSPDGSRLLSGTYVGGSGEREWISTHNLAVDAHGNAYVAIPTESRDFPTTTGAYCRTYSGGRTDWGVVKISPTGGLVAGTYIGGSSNENPDGIYVDAAGNVLITGETGSDDFPVTASALQGRSGGANDAVVVRLSADFGSLLYSTYLGGGAYDNGRSGCLGADGSLLVTGASDGAGWPVRSACQEAFAGGGGGRWGNGDCIIARLSPRGVAR